MKDDIIPKELVWVLKTIVRKDKHENKYEYHGKYGEDYVEVLEELIIDQDDVKYYTAFEWFKYKGIIAEIYRFERRYSYFIHVGNEEMGDDDAWETYDEARYFCFKEILNGMILMGESNNKEIFKKHENEQNI